MGQNRKIDKVRASRDGHEFHEAWTARKAMQLLWPDTDLTAIAVEGPSPEDQAGAPAATVEVADLTFYYGRRPNFEDAVRTTFAQFKYSIADQNKDFRASHAKKTVEKFGATYRSDGPHPGLRLLCKSSVLRKVLVKYDRELLLLFDLQRYEKETYRSSGRFSHSIGVVRIDKSLNVEYFKGRVNYSNKSEW